MLHYGPKPGMTKLSVFIAVLLLVSCGKGPEPRTITSDITIKMQFGTLSPSSLDEKLNEFASKHDMKLIIPQHKIEFSDGVTYVRALRKADKDSGFYCITVSNIKNSAELVIELYKSACEPVKNYESMKDELNSMFKSP
jgi:hypothetical protein